MSNTKIDDMSQVETQASDVDDKTGKEKKFPKVFTDTPTGEPISLTEDELNNLVELFRGLATIRDRNKTPT